MKSILILCGMLVFLSISPTFAQQRDTTIMPSSDYMKEMVRITPADLPDAVREVLQDTQYKGWEAGEIYRNRNADRFLVRIVNETIILNDRAIPKEFLFDQTGKPIKKTD